MALEKEIKNAEAILASEEESFKRKMEPYKVYRAGNFKLRLVRLQIDDKGNARVLNKNAHFKKSFLDKEHLEEIYAIEVKTLEELWSVRIPETYGMFNLIVTIIRWDVKEMTDRLGTILGNMFGVSCVPDGFFHNLVAFLIAEVLPVHFDKVSEWKDKREKYDKALADFRWSLDADMEGYEPQEKEDLSEEEYRHAETADKARQVLEQES